MKIKACFAAQTREPHARASRSREPRATVRPRVPIARLMSGRHYKLPNALEALRSIVGPEAADDHLNILLKAYSKRC